MKKYSFINEFDSFFWDLDGTLTESSPGIINSVKYALERFGINETDEEKLKLFVGPPLMFSFQEFYGFSKEDARKAMNIYREYFGEKGLFENSVYKGIKETLNELKLLGKRLFVATAKPEIYMTRILDKFELTDFFEDACGSDLEETRSEKSKVIEYTINKNNLSEEQKSGKILMIGDRKYDIIGAHKNNLKCAGVLWGYGSKEELSENGADFLVENPEDFLR